MQTKRLFEILYILLDKKSIPAGELAAHFGVSTRTIYRDVDALGLAGIPVYTEKGKGGGIRLLPDFVLNKSILSAEEQDEILSALHGLSNIKTADTNQILQKLSTVFNKPTTNWLEVDFSGWNHEHDFFHDFKTAILERRVVRFDYYNSYGEKRHRHVEPIQLWFKSRAWYLKAFCLTKRGVRLYKLSRIKNLTVTDEIFEPQDFPELTDTPDGAGERGQEMIALRLRIAPEMAYRVFDDFYESMVERQPDGSFLATVTWPEDEWVYGFLLSFGESIEILEPVHIRDIIKEKAQKIAEKYL
ncbi:MAG: YafY family transcriptional regulator [Oscillospiraceae bacterium]|nr:YafY family transcriptional regulator [Oscillospiraceae bacterium]